MSILKGKSAQVIYGDHHIQRTGLPALDEADESTQRLGMDLTQPRWLASRAHKVSGKTQNGIDGDVIGP
jgi:hypothetical protein